MNKLEHKILTTIEKYDMLSDGDTVVVAVSGGADSMCLLHFFNKYSSYLHLNNIICAHVNHGIRGAEADRDEAFVREYCKQNSVRFESAHYDVPAVAEALGESIEQCGRRLRYEFFASFAENCKIATAHNLNDSAETFLFNLSRGTGLRGLTGIPAVRDNIIRPLSECTRKDIEQYLYEEKVYYVTDSTNNSDDYTRNKLRHNVLPVLSEINPSFYNVFLGCINTLDETEKYLDKETDIYFEKAKENDRFLISEIACCDKVIRTRLLIKIAECYGAKEIEKKHIALLDDIITGKGAVMLHNKLKIVSDGKYLFYEKELPSQNDIFTQYSSEITEYDFPACTIRFETADITVSDKFGARYFSHMGYFDADKLTNAVFRLRAEGDRFTYPFAEHSKSLKNLYKEKNISKEDRYGIPLLANEDGILWIDKVGVSDLACVTADTKKILRIIITRKVSVV